MCIRDRIGNEWITDLSNIKKLSVYVDDEKCQQEFMNIKYQNKIRLAKYILSLIHISSPDSPAQQLSGNHPCRTRLS